MRALYAAALLAAAAAPGLAAQTSYRADSTAIVAAARAFSAALVSNDSMALGQLYSDTAVAFPPGREVVGRAAIRHYFARPAGSAYVQVSHVLTTERLNIDGNVAVDVGTWSSTGGRAGQEPNTATDRYLVVWVRESDGKWRILYDMWHTPRPPG